MLFRRFSWIVWGCLLACIVGLFFFPSLFQHHTLVPTDILHHFLLPHAPEPIEVQNHYIIDQVTQTYPSGLFWQESARQGEMPLWNPYIYGGHPQLSTSVWGILCPAKLLFLVCSPERAHTLGFILQLFLAGFFMMLFLREWGLSGWASLLGGCAYAFNSQFLMMYWIWLNVFAYVPLVLLLYERSLRRKSQPYALVTGVVMAIPLVSGSIQMTFFVCCLCGFYGLASVFWQPAGQRRPVFLRLALVFAVTALAGAIQFLPTLEFLAQEVGGRIRNSEQGRMHTMLHIVAGIPALITFVFPAVAGSPETFDVLKVFRGTMMHYSGYIGLIPVTLFVMALQKRGDKRINSLLILIVLTLVVIFFTPLLRFVYHRFFIMMVFAMAVLAAVGFDMVLQKAPEDLLKIRRSLGLISILAVLLIAGLFALQWYLQGHYSQMVNSASAYILKYRGHQFQNYQDWLLSRVPGFFAHYQLTNPLFWVPLSSFAGFMLLWCLYAGQKLHRNLFAGLVICLLVSDLTVLGRTLVPQVDLAKYPLYPPVPLLAKPQADPSLFRISRWMPRDPLTLCDNVCMAYGLASPSGYESLLPENLVSFPTFTNDAFNALLDLQNVKYLITDGSVPLPAARFDLLAESYGKKLFLNKSVMPRLNFIPKWEVVPERTQILGRMTAADFDPRTAVFLEREPASDGSLPTTITGEITAPEVAVKNYSAQKVTVNVRASKPGILLLSDTWYPGWKVRVDGKPAGLLRADYVLKAVHLPAGNHLVEFYFAPVSFRIGAIVSGVTIVLALIAALFAALQARKNRPTSASTETTGSEILPAKPNIVP